MHRYRCFLLVFLLSKTLPVCSQSLSPQVVASAGGFVSAGNNTLSYTVGQPVAALISSAGGTLTQGFQQTTRVSLITAIDPVPVLNLQVFPNPATHYLRVEGPAAALTLVDLLGRPRWQGQSIGQPLLIDLHDFTDGVYLLTWQTGQATQSTRIVLQR